MSESPSTIRLSDFITSVLSEVSEASFVSHEGQYIQREDLEERLGSSLAEYVERHIDGERVEISLREMFPSSLDREGSWTLRGATYTLRPEESPPFSRITGSVLSKAEGEVSEGRVTAKGAVRVRRAMATFLGERDRLLIGELLAAGVPSVMLDSGRVLAKVIIGTMQEPQEPRGLRANLHQCLTALLRGGSRRSIEDRQKALYVRPSTESSQGAHLLGEVEIRFKSI